jgi:glucose-6-phosphate isomerase
LSKDGTPEHVYFTTVAYIQEGHPNTPELIAELTKYGQKVRTSCDAVVFCGIGGSYLGGKVLYDSFTSRLWDNAPAEPFTTKIYFSGNSVDVDDMEAIWQEILLQGKAQQAASGKKMKVAVIPISKSGTTLEPLSAFLYFYAKLQENKDYFQTEVAVVTDKTNTSGPFNILAAKYGWELFDLVEGIGGRFSVLSTPGLIVAAVLGMDIDKLLEGARDMDKACQSDSLAENPALANAVYKYLAFTKHGCNIEVMMPYGSSCNPWATGMYSSWLNLWVRERIKKARSILWQNSYRGYRYYGYALSDPAASGRSQGQSSTIYCLG